jgi:uncharacterized protein
MKESGKGTKIEDRLLGDEWADWRPDARGSGSTEAPIGLFVLFSSCVVLMALLGVWLLWYLALPRFESFGRSFVVVIRPIFIAFAFLLALCYLLGVISAVWKIKILPPILVTKFFLTCLFSPAAKFASIFGISRDKIGNSGIRFHNELMFATGIGRGAKKILLLLPRCLSKETRGKIRELSDKYQLVSYTASGGDEARKAIKDCIPETVIGVACERDLMSGIQDISPQTPVFGIPNKRPEGPCKNTSADVEELERIVRFCLNS